AAEAGVAAWDATPCTARADALVHAAALLEANRGTLLALLQNEGGKTLDDALSEVREATDYCRYYAAQARTTLAAQILPGPTGESNMLRYRGRGVFVCISPWNFPLAIFLGQISAALVSGNAVLAKPASQTRRVAVYMEKLIHEAGVPTDVFQLIIGSGKLGGTLVAHPAVAGVSFTGSTSTAQGI